MPDFRRETMAGRVDAEAVAAGRDPAEIRRVVNVSGTFTDGRSEGLQPDQAMFDLA